MRAVCVCRVGGERGAKGPREDRERERGGERSAVRGACTGSSNLVGRRQPRRGEREEGGGRREARQESQEMPGERRGASQGLGCG